MHFLASNDDLCSAEYPSNPISEQNMGLGEIDG